MKPNEKAEPFVPSRIDDQGLWMIDLWGADDHRSPLMLQGHNLDLDVVTCIRPIQVVVHPVVCKSSGNIFHRVDQNLRVAGILIRPRTKNEPLKYTGEKIYKVNSQVRPNDQ